VLCLRPGSPLARRSAVTVCDGLDGPEPAIAMRSGYVMHRYAHRLLRGRSPDFSFSTDGAEMGKLMVAEGLGATLLPDFSVIGDPLERDGAITCRPLEPRGADVLLMIQRRRSGSTPRAARDLHQMVVNRAGAVRGRAAGGG